MDADALTAAARVLLGPVCTVDADTRLVCRAALLAAPVLLQRAALPVMPYGVRSVARYLRRPVREAGTIPAEMRLSIARVVKKVAARVAGACRDPTRVLVRASSRRDATAARRRRASTQT